MDTIKEILTQTTHRQYPLPQKPWKYYQEWQDVLMLHYIADKKRLEALLPPGLALDTFEGKAWVSIFTFSVSNLRPRGLPALPYVSDFNEINLRTYVVRDGIPGIYMLAIEADKLADVLLPRWLLGIPYLQSGMLYNKGYYSVENKTMGRRLKVMFYPGTALDGKDILDLWLTERHALYLDKGKKRYRFDIHHREWKLRHSTVTSISQNYTQDVAPEGGPQRQHYAKHVKVVIWGRKKLT